MNLGGNAITNYRSDFGVEQNIYQRFEEYPRVLFVCTMGILRSATASHVFSDRFNTRACGVRFDALVPISDTLLRWADCVVFMHENVYREYIQITENSDLLPTKPKVSIIVNIPDIYSYKSKELIEEFQTQLKHKLNVVYDIQTGAK